MSRSRLPATPAAAWVSPWLKGWEISLTAPVVAATRLSLLGAGIAPAAESSRMVTEKIAAFSTAGMASTRALLELQGRLLAQTWRLAATPPALTVTAARRKANRAMLTVAQQATAAAPRIAEQAVAPIHKTVKRNARRLG